MANYDDLVRSMKIPKMMKIEQVFDRPVINDVENAVREQLKRKGTLDRIKKGMNVAITAGSRGIRDIARVIKCICDEVKKKGATPFVIPAMGSHGGSTAEGQLDILRLLGITEEYIQVPIRATMEVIELGKTKSGITAMFDKYAFEADATIVVNRIKAHPAFKHKVESGIAKMVVIGLGKQKGAAQCHSTAVHKLGPYIEEVADYVLSHSNIVFGVGILENAYDETFKIVAIPSEKILEEEPSYLLEAKQYSAKIYLKDYDVLIIDEIGKNISGAGVDTTIIER
ncbi:MAG: lactate racemase domain-containing protein, partial [Clostridia bacterium]